MAQLTRKQMIVDLKKARSILNVRKLNCSKSALPLSITGTERRILREAISVISSCIKEWEGMIK